MHITNKTMLLLLFYLLFVLVSLGGSGVGASLGEVENFVIVRLLFNATHIIYFFHVPYEKFGRSFG